MNTQTLIQELQTTKNTLIKYYQENKPSPDEIHNITWTIQHITKLQQELETQNDKTPIQITLQHLHQTLNNKENLTQTTIIKCLLNAINHEQHTNQKTPQK